MSAVYRCSVRHNAWREEHCSWHYSEIIILVHYDRPGAYKSSHTEHLRHSHRCLRRVNIEVLRRAVDVLVYRDYSCRAEHCIRRCICRRCRICRRGKRRIVDRNTRRVVVARAVVRNVASDVVLLPHRLPHYRRTSRRTRRGIVAAPVAAPVVIVAARCSRTAQFHP